MDKTKTYKEWVEEYKKIKEEPKDPLLYEDLKVLADETWCGYLYLQYLIEEEDWDTLKNMAKELQNMPR